MSEEETREQIEEIINNNNEEPIKEEVKQEEPIKEEVKQEIKPKSKAKSKAKPKQIKITKEPVEPVQKIEEPVVEEPVVEEPVVEEKPKKIDKLKEIVKCPDCNLEMTQHTLKYIHKRRGFCKADLKTPEVKTPEVTVPSPSPQPEQPKTKITEDIVNDYIKENPDIISNYLRNERALKAQRKQMNARSLLNNAF
jgi:hypothetical protein